MKKNFFMVMILSLVFLGLGNVSYGASDQATVTLWQGKCPTATLTIENTEFVNEPSDGYCCVEEAGKAKGTGLPLCTTEEAQGQTSCHLTSSDLNGDPNAIMGMLGVSCKCKPTYGEYYDATKGKNQCGLCTRDDVCCGTKLNTKIPFIGNCIESSAQASGSVVNETTAFPILVGSLIKILVSVILITSFILIIAAGVMWSTGDAKGGKDMIIKVAIGLAILGASGVILRLINPNFFG